MRRTILGVHKWSGGSGLTKTAIQHLIQMEGLQPYTWSGLPGNVYSMQGVPYHRIMWIAEGSMTVKFPENGQLICLRKGDRLDLPPGIPHQAVVGLEGTICIEAHCKIPAQQLVDLSSRSSPQINANNNGQNQEGNSYAY